MGEEYTVNLTALAESQLSEIVHYIAEKLQSRSTALKMLKTLKYEISSLSHMPNRIPLTDEEPWHSEGIHKMTVKNYLVYFWVNEAEKKVQVTAIIYAGRDQRSQLEMMNF